MSDKRLGGCRPVRSTAARVALTLLWLTAPGLVGCNCGGDDQVDAGRPQLCVFREGAQGCEPDGSDLDWGAPPAGEVSTMLVTLMNTSADSALLIDDVRVTDQTGGARHFEWQLCLPTCDVQVLGMPTSLAAGAAAQLSLTFDATELDGLVPAEVLEIASNTVLDELDPVGIYARPFAGVTEGCLEGRVDANADKSDGCECEPSDGTEYCDNIDNDCDGTVDEDVPGTGIPCNTGFPGLCEDGTTACAAGVFSCQALMTTTEVCDGEDNDCDGSTDEENSWVPFNEGLTGGNMATVELDPRHAGVAYAVAGNRVYRSANGGASFALAGEAPHAIEAFAFPSDDPMVILGASLGGLLSSDDDGATWTDLALSGFPLVSILVHPADPGRIFVGTIGGGIYRSTNGGQGFGPVNQGVPFSRISSLVGDPSDPDIVVAGLELLDAQSAFNGTGEIVRTTNGGANWTTEMTNIGRVPRISGCPTNANVMYAAVIYVGGQPGGVAESQDGGQSWSIVGLPNDTVMDVAVAPSNCATLYASTQNGGVYRSTNGAQSFSGPYTTGLDVQFPGALEAVVDSADPDNVLAANHSGVFLSTDAAATWARVPAIDAGIVRALGVSAAAPDTVWMSTWGQGPWVRVGMTASWNKVPNSMLPRDWSMTVAPDQNDANRVLIGTFSDVWRTTDGGSSFSAATGPQNPFAFGYHPADPQILYVGTQVGGVWKSVDGGQSYAQTNTGLPAPWPTGPCTCQDVRALVVDQTTPNNVYVGTNLRGVFVSNNAGASWQAGAASLAGESINCLVQDGGGDVWACVAGEGIWRSSDGAQTFTKVTQGMASLNNAASIFIDDTTGDLYASSDGGVFRTSNGTTWEDMDSLCLPKSGVTTPVIMDDGGQRLLLVGTGGVGVYKLPLP